MTRQKSIDPVEEAFAIREQMGRMLEDVVRSDGWRRDNAWVESWRPSLDLVETPEAFVLRVELPGVAREDLELEAQGRQLTLRGVKRYTRDVAQTRYLRIECDYGRFERHLELPSEIDPEQVTAKLAGGILLAKLPKLAPQVTRKIAIEDA